MRRALAAATLLVAAGALVLALVPPAAPLAPVAQRTAPAHPPVMPDVAAIDSLRSVARIGAGQARALRAAVRRCRAASARGPCVLVALEGAAAGSNLSGVVLRAVAARLPPGPCMNVAARLAGLVSAIASLAGEGVASRTWPGATWAAALAAARAGARVVAVRDGPWPRHCRRSAPALRA